MHEVKELERIASQVRRDIIRMTNRAASGHPGGSLGSTDFLVALYFNILEYDPRNFTMDGKGEDIFFLSIGHISPLLYSVLARSGHFDTEELNTFRFINSRLQGHPATEEGLPGIRIATGSLGQGLSVAAGAALAKRLNNDNSFVYCLLGDGECEEGQVWEAAMFSAAKNIDNLIAVVDYNGKQIDGPVDEVMPLGDFAAKWKAFDWEVLEMNGHDMANILEVLSDAKSRSGKGKPVVILMKTEMGHGVDFMAGTHKWHGSPPNDEQVEQALSQLKETLGDY